MGGLSMWHWIIVLTFSVIWLVPFWRIIKKAGFPGVLSLLALVPLVNIVLLWVFAFIRWPVERDPA